jgi:hypothetical protein
MSTRMTSDLPLQQPWGLEKPPRRGLESLAPVALVIALAGLGIGIYAVAKMPAVSQGPAGPQGAAGARGAAGPAGPSGVPGSAGTITDTSMVAGAALKSVPNPPVGTVLTATTACPSGSILLSGGAQVSAPGVEADRHVQLRSSLAVDKTHWQTVAIVTGSLGAGNAMAMKPFVMCGAAPSTTTSTPTTAAPPG